MHLFFVWHLYLFVLVCRENLWRYLPCYMLCSQEVMNRNACEVKILTMHGQYEDLSTTDATAIYLTDFQLIAKQEFYGVSFFPVLYLYLHQIWELVFLGISQQSVLIVKPVVFDVIAQYSLSQVLSCGFDRQLHKFYLIVGGVHKHEYVSFWTNNGQELRELVTFYKQWNAERRP